MQVYSKNQTVDPDAEPLVKGKRPELPIERVLALVTDAFTGATERQIEVGDGVEIYSIIKGKGVQVTYKGQSRSSLASPCLRIH